MYLLFDIKFILIKIAPLVKSISSLNLKVNFPPIKLKFDLLFISLGLGKV